jgi:hypothetical protein
MTNINFSDMLKAAGDAGFSVLPAGTYDAVVDTASNKQVSGGEKEAIAVQFKVENGPNAGQSCFNNFVISPDNANALAFFFRHMAALGLNEQYFQSNPPLQRVAADLIGRRCRIKVSIRQWQEQDRNQVDGILPPIGDAQAPAMPGTSPALPVPSSAVPGPPIPNQLTHGIPVPPAPVVPDTPLPAPTIIPPPPGDDDLPF